MSKFTFQIVEKVRENEVQKAKDKRIEALERREAEANEALERQKAEADEELERQKAELADAYRMIRDLKAQVSAQGSLQ